ncbi:hypothetical protein BCR33DRAFT_761452 [Rhizoclosmatium globosum]|uniref:FAD dependent oxidoreductase domain-containing protein n=1 Tax=Rhizoclosmatium globosum TaxID=329046 RepID=A0A1Y2D265_9FUNG|nr:hypothetical protein BCR33DRAFT_761452 [Rhizoclosmatium globosum]|eukprot:ORY53206.1 hypothetical protein BCR33DRAFT_761452 [Rhizoclosmatium globosum]
MFKTKYPTHPDPMATHLENRGIQSSSSDEEVNTLNKDFEFLTENGVDTTQVSERNVTLEQVQTRIPILTSFPLSHSKSLTADLQAHHIHPARLVLALATLTADPGLPRPVSYFSNTTSQISSAQLLNQKPRLFNSQPIPTSSFKPRTKDVGESDDTASNLNQDVSTALREYMKRMINVPVKVQHEWAGIMGFTRDGFPLVGELAGIVDGCNAKGEFILAGFTGHGMSRCFLTAEAVAHLVVGKRYQKNSLKCSCYQKSVWRGPWTLLEKESHLCAMTLLENVI